MAKIALIADTHLGVRNDNPHLLENMHRSFDFFFEELNRRKIDDIVHLGDLYDRRKYVNFNTARMVREWFLQPASHNFRTHIIMGNHDQYFKDTHEVNALREMVSGRYSNINVYSTTTEVKIAGLPILFVPWISSGNRNNTIQDIANSRAKVVMGHLELNGFEMYKGGIVMEHGDDPDVFKKFEAVYTGHFHKKSSNKNIHYIGAMAEFYWSDFNCPRGFSILNTDTLELEFVENPHKIFKQIKYDDSQDKNFVQVVNNSDYSEYANTYVKVIVTKRDNPFAFDTMMDKLYDVGPVDISIVEDVGTIIDIGSDETLDEAQDTPSILDSYISGLTLTVPMDRMQGYMREVYKEAISTNEAIE